VDYLYDVNLPWYNLKLSGQCRHL